MPSSTGGTRTALGRGGRIWMGLLSPIPQPFPGVPTASMSSPAALTTHFFTRGGTGPRGFRDLHACYLLDTLQGGRQDCAAGLPWHVRLPQLRQEQRGRRCVCPPTFVFPHGHRPWGCEIAPYSSYSAFGPGGGGVLSRPYTVFQRMPSSTRCGTASSCPSGSPAESAGHGGACVL